MTAGPSTLAPRRLTARQNPAPALLIAAVTFSAIALFDLIAHPAGQHALRTWKEYLLTATLLPGTCVVFWVLSSLQGLHSSHQERLGRTGLRIAAIGLLALLVDGIVTLASGTTDTVGPLYPVGMLASLIGVVLMAIQWYRAAVLPRWAGPALALGWLLGATPVLGSGGAFFILAAAFVAIAIGLRHQAPAHSTPQVELDSPVTA